MGQSKIILFAKKYNRLISLFLAFWGISSLSAGLKLGGGSLILTNSIFSVIFFVMFYGLINYTTKHFVVRTLVYSVITGIFFSMCLIFGTQIYLIDSIELMSLSTLLNIVGLGLILSSLIYLLLEKLPFIENWCFNHDLKKVIQLFNAKPRYFFIVWTVIFISWLPTLLTAFPGIYGYDSIYQMSQFLSDHRLSAHHPILHSLYMYGTLSFGKSTMGSYAAGMAVYSITQMLMMSATFSYVCFFLAKLKLPVFFQSLTIVYFCFLPIHSMFAVSSTKDVLFSAALILLILCTVHMILRPIHFFSSTKDQLLFVTLTFLMFILRNNGVDLFILSIPLFVICFRKYWIKIITLCLISLSLYWFYTGPIYQLLNVQKSDIREAMSVPIQQIARAMRDNSTEITKNEKQTIYEIIPEKALVQYSSRLADPVKNNFQTDVFKKNPVKYLKVWMNVGIKCPMTYINAFVSNNFGYWYPDMNYPDVGAWHPYIEYKMTDVPGDYLLIKRHSLIPQFESYYNDIAYKTVFQKIPVISMLFNEGFAFWMLILTGIVCFYRKQYKLFLPFALLIGLWFTLLLSPVVLLRYAYPIMIAEPLMFAIILFGSRFNTEWIEDNDQFN